MAKISYDWEFRHTEDYMLLPADYLQIRGLGFFGHLKFNSAQESIWDHYHETCMEVSVGVSGRQRMSAGGKYYILKAGDVLFNYPMEVHGSGDDPQEVSERYYFGLDCREPKGFLELATPWDQYYYDKLKNWDKRQAKVTEKDIELLRQSFTHFSKLEKNRDDIESRMLGYSYFFTFLNRMLPTAITNQSSKEGIKRVVTYIQDHIQDSISMEDLVAVAELSMSHLRKCFKEETGVSPKEYINREKIELAKKILQQEQIDSITKIAYQLGFSDSDHFSNVFRHYMNCSPRDFRRQWLLRKEMGEEWTEQLDFDPSTWLK